MEDIERHSSFNYFEKKRTRLVTCSAVDKKSPQAVKERADMVEVRRMDDKTSDLIGNFFECISYTP